MLAPGETVPCTVTAEDIYSLVTFHADLTGVTRLDLWSGDQRFEDIPFEPHADRIYTLTSSVGLRVLPSIKIPMQLVSVAADGSERVVGHYTLDHTAYVPR